MKVKTSELSGKALDWATGIAIGFDVRTQPNGPVYSTTGESFNPSVNWLQCGRIIEFEGIEFKWVSDATLEAHSYLNDPHYGYGLTHQEAACRLMVVSKLGDEVDIPDELMEATR